LAPNWICRGAVLLLIAVITPKFAALIFPAGAVPAGPFTYGNRPRNLPSTRTDVIRRGDFVAVCLEPSLS
jgi:hypothetical protein